MISYNFLLHLMNDPFTLSWYMERGKYTSWGKFIQNERLDVFGFLQKNWMQCAHLEDSFIPNHIYGNWNEVLKQDSGKTQDLTLKDVFLKLLPTAADEIFELDGDLIVVRESQLDYWQHLSKSFSPLVLGVAYLWFKRNEVADMKKAIKDNFANTAIPSHHFTKGWTAEVADLHVHFNSGMEADYKWVKVLESPEAFVNFDRTTHHFGDYQDKSIIKDYNSMSNMLLDAAIFLEKVRNRMKKLDRQHNFGSELASHAWLVYHCFQQLEKQVKLDSFYDLHQYLLIAGVFRQLFVVQYHQIGLEQFSQVLHLPFKGPYCESDYARQLLRQQVNGKTALKIEQIEFRIGASQLGKIAVYRQGFSSQNCNVDIKFIVSLIKSFEIDKQGRIKGIGDSLREIDKHKDEIVGIDVAGKDYNAPPSKFVDAFAEIRKMKKKSPWRFTYHAGEDFFHILTGMRMIYEAVTLLKLQPTDRIGHASAAGVNPRNWARCIHGVVPMKQGEYLEDLKFINDFIKYRNITIFRSKISDIDDYITSELPSAKTIPGRIIKVDCFQFFNVEELRILQKELLSYLSEKGIVIEACPTSNICIGYDHSLRSYHLRTWLRWKYILYLPIPDIIIGSDEIGVFPTNISNEYACVYEMLMMDDELKGHAKTILDDLAKNSMKYTFF